ncbi:hypothetical protein ACONUD_07460 [Microbulbifer harenosus]|uniref:Uncharacterized protein n=1 Tax=Microbulbifer harenosus TaxID=2576840 RepID=A0ABY2UGD0_9GAMM|nr:hypothetical protein [Microbulbifer harenosus]TLM73180.1 hypothetical protein FDY93_19180 [Microbulbifer harenosus]
MKFTEKELKLIQKAEARVKQMVLTRVIAIVIAVVLIMLFFLGLVSSEELAYGAFGLAVLSIISPQLGGAPKYEQLVSVLSAKLEC